MDTSLLTNLAFDYDSFEGDDLCFDISMRNYPTGEFSPIDYVRLHYPFLKLSQIKSVYGFHELFTPLYGGRTFSKAHVLTTPNLEEFYDHEIDYYIPLSNHYIDEQSYEESLDFLDIHHRTGNTIACVSDNLARWIRRDFPQYRLSASIIKNLSQKETILEALELYDSVVVPTPLNNNLHFLENFDSKERLILFANSTCRYTCPAWICYEGMSQKNKDLYSDAATSLLDDFICSQKGENPMYREKLGYVVFNLDTYYNMGYRHFKLVPPHYLEKTFQHGHSEHKNGSTTFFCSNEKKQKKPPDISKDTNYVVTQNIKQVFKSRDFQTAIRKSIGFERTLFCELNSIMPVFKTSLSIAQAFNELKGRFSVSEDDLLSFLQTLIRYDLLIEEPPQFEQPLFIVSASMVDTALLFKALSHIKAFWTIENECSEIIEGIRALHPSHINFDSDRLCESEVTPSIKRLLNEGFTKYLRNSRGESYIQLPYSDRPEKVRLLINDSKSALRIPFFKKVFPDAKFIYLQQGEKDAIDSIKEGWRSGQFITHFNLPDWPLQRWSFLLPPDWRNLKNRSLNDIAAFQWQVTNEIILQDLGRLSEEDWCLTDYDVFIQDPLEESEHVCEFIKAEMDEKLVRYLTSTLLHN